MKIKYGSVEFEAVGILTLKNKDKVLAACSAGREATVVAAWIPLNTTEALIEARIANDNDELLAFVQPNGAPRYIVSNLEHFSAAEEIALAFNREHSGARGGQCEPQVRAEHG